MNKFIKPAMPRPYSDVFPDFPEILSSRNVTRKLPTIPFGVVKCALLPFFFFLFFFFLKAFLETAVCGDYIRQNGAFAIGGNMKWFSESFQAQMCRSDEN